MSSSENITLFSSASFIIGGVAATIVTPLVIACLTILCMVPFEQHAQLAHCAFMTSNGWARAFTCR
jgi:hypothetical protein